MKYTLHQGIYFYENIPPVQLKKIKAINIELGGVISQAQLKTLKDVKDLMASLAKEAGGNAIINFQYGQKSVGWFRSMFQLDDVNWYGSGIITLISINCGT